MSEENVQLVRQALEAFNSGDTDRVMALTHPDLVAEVPAELSAEPDTYRGHDGMRRYLESFWEAMDEVRFEGERFFDAGDSVVIALRVTARGRQTALVVEQRSAGVWTVEDGKVIHVTAYASLEQALQAAGLAG